MGGVGLEMLQKIKIWQQNRPTARHKILKMAKVSDKESILKAAREKQNVTYKGTL